MAPKTKKKQPTTKVVEAVVPAPAVVRVSPSVTVTGSVLFEGRWVIRRYSNDGTIERLQLDKARSVSNNASTGAPEDREMPPRYIENGRLENSSTSAQAGSSSMTGNTSVNTAVQQNHDSANDGFEIEDEEQHETHSRETSAHESDRPPMPPSAIAEQAALLESISANQSAQQKSGSGSRTNIEQMTDNKVSETDTRLGSGISRQTRSSRSESSKAMGPPPRPDLRKKGKSEGKKKTTREEQDISSDEGPPVYSPYFPRPSKGSGTARLESPSSGRESRSSLSTAKPRHSSATRTGSVAQVKRSDSVAPVNKKRKNSPTQSALGKGNSRHDDGSPYKRRVGDGSRRQSGKTSSAMLLSDDAEEERGQGKDSEMSDVDDED